LIIWDGGNWNTKVHTAIKVKHRIEDMRHAYYIKNAVGFIFLGGSFNN